ncbi:ABC transporter permease [uncultured Mobiluncus sp.]|uniref:ABC transporter permease n=1 Tax=uncultured Mobiluncus sp. TaxID=293425 RepID=UPI0026205CD0|nr:ABC transporter permease [uncultured Mobiluncus sp.]
MLFTEAVLLCAIFFLLCFLGTGTDAKNLKNYSSYPDEVQIRISAIPEYQNLFRVKSQFATFMANFLLFLVILFVFGIFIRQSNFTHNFLSLLFLGQTLNAFDLIVIDLLWWRRTPRIRFSKLPQPALYQDPRKHISAFIRAFIMYFAIALIDGYLLTLF